MSPLITAIVRAITIPSVAGSMPEETLAAEAALALSLLALPVPVANSLRAQELVGAVLYSVQIVPNPSALLGGSARASRSRWRRRCPGR